MQVAEHTSAQLQQQLARKGTHLSSAQRELARLRQELSQAQQSKHEATKVRLPPCLLVHCNEMVVLSSPLTLAHSMVRACRHTMPAEVIGGSIGAVDIKLLA